MATTPTGTSSRKDSLINLWNKEDLEDMGHGQKHYGKLTKKQLLDEVLVLLYAADDIEENAIIHYLKPLEDDKIFKEKGDATVYYIGKYGKCTAAVATFNHDAVVPNCFKNLKAVISVGVAYGIKDRAQVCDVLVAEKIINHDHDEKGVTSKNNTRTSKELSEIFERNVDKWLDNNIKVHLDGCNVQVSTDNYKKGIIIRVPSLHYFKTNKKSILKLASDREAIGIEVKTADLFEVTQNVIHMNVKAVCSLEDDQEEKFQPVAALIAANCVEKHLDNPEVSKLLQKKPATGEDEDKALEIYRSKKIREDEDKAQERYESKKIFPLQQILNQVLVLLLTMDKNENDAAFYYLEPLPGHSGVYKYMQCDTTELAIYFIGQYGVCPVAIRQTEPDSADTAPALAKKCFKNLKAIIGMGAACGEKNKVEVYDVLVAKKVINCDPTSKTPTSGLLTSLFRQNIKWVDDDTKEFSDISELKIQHGEILCGCKHIIDDKEKIRDAAPNAIGFDIKPANYFAKAENIPVHVHMTIVKGVYSLKEGHEDKRLQPIAALLAANCVKKVFDDPLVPEMFRNPDVNDHMSDSDDYSPSPKRMRSYTGDDFPDYGYSRRGSEESRRSQESRRRSSTSISARKNLNFGSSIHGESNSENQRKSKRRYTEGGYSSMQRFTNERIFHSPVSSFELKIFSPINEERRSEAESINITMSSPVIKRRRNSL